MRAPLQLGQLHCLSLPRLRQGEERLSQETGAFDTTSCPRFRTTNLALACTHRCIVHGVFPVERPLSAPSPGSESEPAQRDGIPRRPSTHSLPRSADSRTPRAARCSAVQCSAGHTPRRGPVPRQTRPEGREHTRRALRRMWRGFWCTARRARSTTCRA